jgi:acetyl-CoA synthetase
MPGKSYAETVKAFDWAQVRAALGWTSDAPVSLGHAIVDRHAASGRPALISIAEDGSEQRLSYAELATHSDRFAAVLQALGVRPGDRVAGLMPRRPETLIVIIGTLKAGAIYVPIFTGFGLDAVDYRLQHSGSEFLVTHHRVRSQVRPQTATRIICVSDSREGLANGDLDFWSLMMARTEIPVPVARRRDDPAAIIYTSGSTGQPKGGVIAVNFLAAVWPYIVYGLDLKPDDVFWPTGDPGWGYGFVCYLGALAMGATVISLEPNPSPQMLLSILGQYRVTNLATTPTMLRSLMSMGEHAVHSTEVRLRAISSCGEPLNAKVVEFFHDASGIWPMDHYGATEYALPIGNHNAIDMAVKPGSMGLPAPGFRMTILGEDGAELPAGQIGLIGKRMNTDCLYWMRYWNDAEASRELVRNGWIIAGDLGRRDDDGYFWFEGRAGDMIKSAGYRIGPFEVESALIKHPAVAEAAVVGKPDLARGQIVKAFVTLKQNFMPSAALSDELVQLVKTSVGRHQYPREIAFVDSLPKTETGKIQRFILRKRA